MNFRRDTPAGMRAGIRAIFDNPRQESAGRITQVKYDLVSARTAATLTQSSTNGDGWTSHTNARTKDANLASVLRQTQVGGVSNFGLLDFFWAAVTGKDDLTITKVELVWYPRFIHTAGAPPIRLRLDYDATQTATVTKEEWQGAPLGGNQSGQTIDWLTSGLSYDITNDPPSGTSWTWANIGQAHASVFGSANASSAVGTTDRVDVDALLLRVTATRTDVL